MYVANSQSLRQGEKAEQYLQVANKDGTKLRKDDSSRPINQNKRKTFPTRTDIYF